MYVHMYACVHVCVHERLWSVVVRGSQLSPNVGSVDGTQVVDFRPPGFLLLLGGWVLALKFQTSNLLASCHSLLNPRITRVHDWTRF